MFPLRLFFELKYNSTKNKKLNTKKNGSKCFKKKIPWIGYIKYVNLILWLIICEICG